MFEKYLSAGLRMKEVKGGTGRWVGRNSSDLMVGEQGESWGCGQGRGAVGGEIEPDSVFGLCQFDIWVGVRCS